MPQADGNDRTNGIDAVKQILLQRVEKDEWKAIDDTGSHVRLKRDDSGIVIHVKRDSLPMHPFADSGFCVFMESPTGIVRGSMREFASHDEMAGHVRDWQNSMNRAHC